MNKKILYHHRTQGKGVEGVHIRGMVDGFRSRGYEVDIISPSGVDPYQKDDKNISKQKSSEHILTFSLNRSVRILG